MNAQNQGNPYTWQIQKVFGDMNSEFV